MTASFRRLGLALFLTLLLVFPTRSSSSAAGGPSLTLQLPAQSPGAQHLAVTARAVDDKGQPMKSAYIVFFLNTIRDGEAITDAQGQAMWHMRQNMPAGKYTISAVVAGQPAVQGSLSVTMAPARLTLTVPSKANVGSTTDVAVRLADGSGKPIGNANVTLLFGGIKDSVARTDANGQTTWHVRQALQPGKYTLSASFDGLGAVLPASISVPLVVGNANLTLQRVPVTGQREAVMARLVDASGQPVQGAPIVFWVNKVRDGEAVTDSQGQATWHIRQNMTAGNYTVAAVFGGQPVEQASLDLTVRPAELRLQTDPMTPQVGDETVVAALLTDQVGQPITNAYISFLLDGQKVGKGRTDSNGRATWRMARSVPAGTYKISATFDGLGAALADSASTVLTIAPAVLEIHTTPVLAGAQFKLGDQIYTADAQGIARLTVQSSGVYSVTALPWTSTDPSTRAAFSRWADNVYTADRSVKIPSAAPLQAGFDMSYLVNHRFVDPSGRPIDAARITALTLTSSTGQRFTLDPVKPAWLPGRRVVGGEQGLEERDISYTLASVIVDGANVVNQGQQRFQLKSSSKWDMRLLFFSAHFIVRDALFGTPTGTAVDIAYPDGHVKRTALNRDGTASVGGLPRGAYAIKPISWGFAPAQPLDLSRSQDVPLQVITLPDAALGAGLLVIIGLGLLWSGRRRQLAPLLGTSRRSRRAGGPLVDRPESMVHAED